jgi:hypothetical protein
MPPKFICALAPACIAPPIAMHTRLNTHTGIQAVGKNLNG